MHFPTLLSSLFPLLSLALAAQVSIENVHTVSCDRKTQNGDKIEVHYIGTLASDGKEFDQSYKRGSPLGFTLGSGMVIKGWEQGLLDMCVGDKRKLTIPPELAYGDRAMGPLIPAYSTLIFETELMGIAGVPSKDEL